MNGVLKQVARGAGLWIAMIVGTILGGVLFHPYLNHVRPDGPLTVVPAMLLVTALDTVVIALLASQIAAQGLRKFAMLLVIIFAIDSGLSAIEAAAFSQWLGLTLETTASIAAAGFVRATVASIAATLLWRGGPTALKTPAPRAGAIVGITATYVVCYLGAGMLIGWQSEAVRNFYGNGVGIDTPLLILLQCGRGLIWAGLATLISMKVPGRTKVVAAMAASAFAVLMAAPLVYPNGLMPWDVRRVHIVEVASSNALFGLLALFILRRPRPTYPTALRS